MPRRLRGLYALIEKWSVGVLNKRALTGLTRITRRGFLAQGQHGKAATKKISTTDGQGWTPISHEEAEQTESRNEGAKKWGHKILTWTHSLTGPPKALMSSSLQRWPRK